MKSLSRFVLFSAFFLLVAGIALADIKYTIVVLDGVNTQAVKYGMLPPAGKLGMQPQAIYEAKVTAKATNDPTVGLGTYTTDRNGKLVDSNGRPTTINTIERPITLTVSKKGFYHTFTAIIGNNTQYVRDNACYARVYIKRNPASR